MAENPPASNRLESIKQLSRRRRVLWIALSTLGLGALVGVAICWQVGTLLTAPNLHPVSDPPSDLPFERVSIPSQSGSTLAGWHHRAAEKRGVVVVAHGIHNSRGGMLTRARLLREAGFSTLLFDLQAHGESPGEIITMGWLEQHDVRAAVEFTRAAHPDEPIAVIGVSLGGAAAILAGPLQIQALVVESVFPRMDRAILNRTPESFGIFRPLATQALLCQFPLRLGCSASDLNPIEHISRAGCPVLVASGGADSHTTEAETRELFAAALEPKRLWIAPDAAHVDLSEASPADYREEVCTFLMKAFQ